MKTLFPLFTALSLMVHGAFAENVTTNIWDSLASYTLGDNPAPPPDAVEKLISETPLDARGPIEEKLIGLLKSATATPEAKWFACRMLQRIGTETCIPSLAALLTDPVLSHYARLTLERFPESEDAGAALLNALEDAPDEVKIGILGSLGERGDDTNIKPIIKLAQHENVAVSVAALEALGKMGGRKVLSAIVKAEGPAGSAHARWDAMLSVATDCGDDNVLEDIFEKSASDAHRGAALRGMLRANESKAAGMMADVILKSESASLRNAALTIAAREGGPKVAAALAKVLGNVPLERQAQLISVLAQAGDSSIIGTIQPLIASEDPQVSKAAIDATAKLGDGAAARALLAQAQGPRQGIFIEAIATMTAPDVTAALVDSLADDGLSAAAGMALAKRDATDAVPALKTLAGTGPSQAREAAWTALGELAGAEDLADLMGMRIAMQDSSPAQSANKAMLDVFSRATDKQAACKTIGDHYDKANEETRMFILDVAAAAGFPEGLTYVRSALTSGNAALYDKAVRALAAWSQYPHACDDLIAVTTNATDDKIRIIALRGYISQATKETNKDALLTRLAVAVPLAKRAEEKRLLIAAAGNRNEPDFVPMIRGYAEDAEVAAEARLSLLNKADHFIKSKNVPEGLIETLKLIVADPASAPELSQRAQAALDKISG